MRTRRARHLLGLGLTWRYVHAVMHGRCVVHPAKRVLSGRTTCAECAVRYRRKREAVDFARTAWERRGAHLRARATTSVQLYGETGNPGECCGEIMEVVDEVDR